MMMKMVMIGHHDHEGDYDDAYDDDYDDGDDDDHDDGKDDDIDDDFFPRHILTAAHCVNKGEIMWVHIGDHDKTISTEGRSKRSVTLNSSLILMELIKLDAALI